MINTIKFQLCKDDKNDAFYEYATRNEFAIKLESVILVMASILCFIFSGFIPLLSIPFVLSIYNIIIVWMRIADAKFQIKKRSIKYMIEYSITIVFLELKKLSEIMKEKNMSENDIERWNLYYVNSILKNKNLNNINVVINNIKDHYQKITLKEFPELKDKEIKSFMKKEAADWWNKYYPDFKKDLDSNVFGKQKVSINSSETKKTGSGRNIKLEQALGKMGLPGSVRDIKVVKARYYELIRRYHPDAPQNKGLDPKEVQNKIIEINMAYQEIEKMLKNNVVGGMTSEK